jgi:hypothetical protein
MAVVTTKSTRISNVEAIVQTLDSVIVNHGRKRSVCATLETVNGDSIASVYRMCRVHSSWRITSIKLFNDAITTCAADLGLYQTSSNPNNGGAVVSVACYASAASLASASLVGNELAYEAKDVANIQRQVWQDAGLTADSNRWYELAFTLTAAAGSAGTLSLEVEYVAND